MKGTAGITKNIPKLTPVIVGHRQKNKRKKVYLLLAVDKIKQIYVVSMLVCRGANRDSNLKHLSVRFVCYLFY